MAGKGEANLAKMMNGLNIWTHKWADVRRCWKCGATFQQTIHTDQGDKRETQASIVDYMIVVGNQLAWVECKSGKTRFEFADEHAGVNAKQRQFLTDWTERGVPCFLYLELGPGNAPKEKQAYLISWEGWQFAEALAETFGMKSLPWRMSPHSPGSDRLNALEFLAPFALKWQPNWGWTIPPDHPFITQSFPGALALPALYAKEKL